jgi:hypothetical protein
MMMNMFHKDHDNVESKISLSVSTLALPLSLSFFLSFFLSWVFTQCLFFSHQPLLYKRREEKEATYSIQKVTKIYNKCVYVFCMILEREREKER